MTDDAGIRQAMRSYITENFLYMRPDLQFGDDDSLLAKGVIDSLGVMELVGFVEEQFAVKAEEADVTEANFGTVGGIARFVEAKQSATRGAAH